MISSTLSRRSFLSLAGSAAIYYCGSSVAYGALVSDRQRRLFPNSLAKRMADGFPPLDGAFVFDQATLTEFSSDFGHFEHRLPVGVLKPGSIADIQKMVTFAWSRSLKITMRGTGGAAYGQTQIENGIIIDSSSMKDMSWVDDETIDVQPGALWNEVIDFTHTRQRTPPVLPDTMFISVGGTLSAGGIGETSYRLGAQVDHVMEVDVVTGRGELLTCSQDKNQELFASVLAGMGQCGFIVRVQMKTLAQPERVWTRQYKYSVTNASLYFADAMNVAEQESMGAIGSHLVRNTDGVTFTYVLDITYWSSETPAWIANMQGETDGVAKSWTYYEYAHRNTKGYLDAVESGAILLPHPYLSFFLPAETSEDFMNYLASENSANLGVGRFAIFPMLNKNFNCRLQRMPKGESSFHIRLYRIVKTGEAGADHVAMIDSNNNDLLPRVFAAQGTVYLPFCPLLNAPQRQMHFGESWLKFAAAKRAFDPESILSPSAGLF